MKSIDVTLDNCHLEPIHIPGSIQSHGFLLVIDPESMTLKHMSANAAEVFQVPKDELLGKSLEGFLPLEITAALRVQNDHFHTVNPLFFRDSEGITYDVVLSANDRFLLLSFERVAAQEQANFETRYYHMRGFLNAIVEMDSIVEIFDRVAREVRAITGFDRVMVYRFDEDYNGEVIAESKIDSLNSFLRQHFPESDIPAQARALYIKNRIRLLADVDAETIPLIPNDEAIDLGSCSLRSVSPIHCQYLRNMGVAASMSISLTLGDRLWGLIACHHYSPKIVHFHTRETAAYLGLTLSHFIAVRAREKHSQLEAKSQSLLTEVLNDIAAQVDYLKGLEKASKNIMNLVDATGMAWSMEGQLCLEGETPSADDVEKIYQWFNQRADVSETIFMCQSLPAENESFTHLSDVASGLLLVRIGLDENQFFMWFRKEIIQTKQWGGKPEKVVEFLDDGSHRLMPRSSFKIWQENVRHRGEPWTELDRVSALKLRNSIVNYVLRRTEEVKKLNHELRVKVAERTAELSQEVHARMEAEKQLTQSLKETKESNEQLEKFAYVASHDLQEPLRKIQSFGSRIESIAANYDDDTLKQYLERMILAANRMQVLIKDLLSFSRVNRSENAMAQVDVDALLRDVQSDLTVLVSETSAQINVAPLGVVSGDRSQLLRLFLNLIQNAIKFTAEGKAPVVDIKVHEKTSESVTYLIRDNGIGFDMEYKDRIFELFQRLHGRAAYSGTGLGLAICKKIMERHGGEIWADSEKGVGTSMYLRFPIEFGV